MLLTNREFLILLVNLTYLTVFSIVAFRGGKAEFLLYIGVILIVGAWIVWKQRQVKLGPTILWGLTVWGVLHMAGGLVHVGDGVLYSLVLVPLVDRVTTEGERLVVLRFDQLIHLYGFAVSTLVTYHLLRPYLRDRIERWPTLALLVVLMSSGLGALNEILEFCAVLAFPETGVGGYANTLLDLCFNLAGGLVAITYLTWRQRASML